MAVPLRVQPDAEHDLREAFDWYESRECGKEDSEIGIGESVRAGNP